MMPTATKPPHPGPQPGPAADASEWSRYAQANGKWSDWIKDHPEDDLHQNLGGQAVRNGEETPRTTPSNTPGDI